MAENTLNMYMVYDKNIGPCEGAALAFAHTVHEARVVSFGYCSCLDMCDYIDVAATRIKGCEWLRKEAESSVPHVVEPKSCEKCGMWGQSEIGDDGLCDKCREELGNDRTLLS